MSRATIESLDHDGRGVAHVDGKVIFIEGALTGEIVEYASFRTKPKYELASVSRVVKASSQRVSPPCPHFGVCGGCSMQHLHPVSQIAAKQRVLEDALWHIGRLHPEQLYAPISGPALGYRYRARLSVRVAPNTGGVLIGFHQKRSNSVTALESCAILPAAVSRLLPELKRLIASMSTPHRLPQIEIAIGAAQTALVLSHLEPLTENDRRHLREFADCHSVVWYLQSKGPESVELFYPTDASPLHYRLADFAVDLHFQPTDFTQVNHGVNQMLVRRAMALLQPEAGERIADFFCGLGNFSLPIARSGADVIGIEGSETLVARAGANAAANGLAARCRFSVANLFEMTPERFARLGRLDKLLIDPPRDGAVDLVNALPASGHPQRIVYISCNPATLARDAAILVRDKGYALRGAGIASMFPHTSHVESIALFEH